MLQHRMSRVSWAVVTLAAVSCLVPGYAQERERDERGRRREARPRQRRVPEAQERETPPTVDPDFVAPDPDRPWARPRYLERRRHRLRGDGSRYTRPRYYYDDYTDRFGVPYYDDVYSDDLERAYSQGLADGKHFERFAIQAERGLASYQQAMDEGCRAFAAEDYGLAARQFLLAATLNQGDPASRLSAAHAHIALNDYEPACRLLRRAFELQPKLVYLPMDVRSAYGTRADFHRHLAALSKAAEAAPEKGDLWFLLGYCHFYSDSAPKAAVALARAVELQPEDKLLARLAHVARISARAGRGASVEKADPSRTAVP